MPDAHHPALSLTKRTALTAAALIAGLWAGAAMAQVPYLEWNGKSTPPPKPEPVLSETLPLAAIAQPAFDIPPSPYGQVGDPFLRPLKWPGKPTPSATPAPIPAPMPVNMTPPPAPRMAPKPIVPPVAPVISPRPADAPKPVPVPATPPVAKIDPPKAISAPAPVPMPKPPVIAAQPVTPPQAPSTAYKLPPTSKYAGRIEAAGPQPVVKPAPETVVAAQKEIAAQTKAPAPIKADPAKPSPKPEAKLATAPEPAAPLAQDIEDDDLPFVPGSRVTNPATQSPRYYSLHRAYGLQPDPTPTTGDLQLDPSQVTTREDSDKPAKK